MAAIPNSELRMTPTEYLSFEREAEIKHEYIDGHVYAMSGGSANHSLIAFATGFALFNKIRSRDCKVYNSDMKVKVTAKLYTYPDVTIVCGQPQFEKGDDQTLLNPTVIIEILSPSTEKYDRGEKFARYRQLASLQEYLMIAQDKMGIEQYVRQPNNTWVLATVEQADQILELPSLGCTLSVADVYAQVTFDELA